MTETHTRLKKVLLSSLMDGIDAHRQEVTHLFETELGKIARVQPKGERDLERPRTWKKLSSSAYRDKVPRWQDEKCLSTQPSGNLSVEVLIDDDKRKKRVLKARLSTFKTATSQDHFMHCATVRSNQICPDDALQRFLPYFGDKSEEENKKILNNFQPYYEYYSILRFQEQKFMLKPILENILQAEHLPHEYVIWYLMQPAKTEEIAGFLPGPADEDLTGVVSIWNGLKHKFIENEERSEKVVTLCRLFKELLKMDLWEIMMLFTPPAKPEPNPANFDDAVCPYCFLFECQNCGIHILDPEAQTAESEATQAPASPTIFCSKSCYKKRHKEIPAVRWSEEQTQILKNSIKLLNEDESRTCLLAKALRKACEEVYDKYTILSGENIGDYDIIRQTVESFNTEKLPQRRKKRKPFYSKPKKNGGANGPRTKWQNGKVLDIGPCDHPGDCIDEHTCKCKSFYNFCEKSCLCPPECSRRWKGCDCVYKNGKNPCRTASCKCFKEQRECDPDLCLSCKAQECIDLPRHQAPGKQCANVSLQRGVTKKTLIGPSLIKGGGIGLFAGEYIPKNAFIGEYLGEIIGSEEAVRRHSTYLQTTSYLFDITCGLTTDAYRIGNKMRFANSHMDKERHNTLARYTHVNGVWHNLWYANKDIPAGKELLISYGYTCYSVFHQTALTMNREDYWKHAGKRMTGATQEQPALTREETQPSDEEEIQEKEIVNENEKAKGLIDENDFNDQSSQVDATQHDSDFPPESDDPDDEDYQDNSSNDERGRGRPRTTSGHFNPYDPGY